MQYAAGKVMLGQASQPPPVGKLGTEERPQRTGTRNG
jgi:hypothetical protein